MGYFDDFLSRVPAEDQAVLNKYPELKASTERMEQKNAQWANWREQNWDPTSNMTKAERALQDELEAARAELASASASGANTQDLATLRREFDAKLAETQKQSSAQVEGMNYFYRTAAARLLPHQKEFGENFDSQKLMDFMQQNRINDPDVAYDKMVAPRRAELSAQHEKEANERHAAELAAAEQKGYEKRAQEAAMGPGGVLPTDSTGGIAGVTARIDKPAQVSDEVKAKLAESKLGDGSISELGYKLFREGAFSSTTQ